MKAACNATVAVDERGGEADEKILSRFLSPRSIVRCASGYEDGALTAAVRDGANEVSDIAVRVYRDCLDVEA